MATIVRMGGDSIEKPNNINELAIVEVTTRLGSAPAPLERPSIPARELVGSFLASFASPRTRRTYAASLRRLAALLSTTPELVPWGSLRYQHTAALRARLLEAKYAPRAVNVTLVALRGILRHARRLGLMTNEEFLAATDWRGVGTSNDDAFGRALPPEEIESIRRWLATQPEGAPRAAVGAVLALMLGAGLRVFEAAALLVDDWTGDGVRVVRKGGKVELVPMGESEAAAVADWLEHRGLLYSCGRVVDHPALLLRPDGEVWRIHSVQSLGRLCTAIARGAGIARFTPHDLRRTFCTAMLRAGVDVHSVQRLMGHAKPETTKRYDRREHEELAAARRKVRVW